MKKIFRFTALVLCIVMLGMTLCSCQYLDDAKANTGVYTDSSKDSFTFRDHLYKKIVMSNKLSFIMSRVQGGCHVTTADVPVLLSASYGDDMYYDNIDGENPTVIRVQKSSGVTYDSRVTAALADDIDGFIPEYEAEVPDDYLVLTDDLLQNYVREDQYDRVKKAVEEATIDHYYVLVYQYNEPTVPWEGGQYVPKLLSEDVTEVIRRTLKGEKTESWSSLPDSEWYSIYLGSCDKELLLTDNNRSLTLLTNGNDYYLFYPNSVEKLYPVAEKDFDVIRKVYSMCRESLEYEDISYYRENAEKINGTSTDSPGY